MPVQIAQRASISASKALSAGLATVVLITACIDDASAQRRRGGAGQPTAITLAEVKIRKINERVAAVGSGRALQQVTMTTRVAGVIEEILFEGGKQVKAGDPLINLDSTREAIAVETAEAQRRQALDTVERYKQLNSTSVSRVQRVEAETTLKVADAALRQAREELDRLTIRAPFDGIMGLTDLETGDYLAIGNPVATIDDKSSLIVEFTVPEKSAPYIKRGLPVRANLIARAGEVYQGKVQSVGTRIDSVSRTLKVRAELPNPSLKLIPGSTFSVSIRLPGNEAAELPGMAIQWDQLGAYVWRANEDNTVERVDIAILKRNGDRVFVDGKLNEGDKIVHEGGGYLRPGETVAPQNS